MSKYTNINMQRIRREIERVRIASPESKSILSNDNLATWLTDRGMHLAAQFIKDHPQNASNVVSYIFKEVDKIRLTQTTPSSGADSTH